MRILIADDEPLARKRLIRLLEKLPSHTLVGEASNGREAIQLCQQQQPDIILLDIRMPELDGIQVAQQLSALKNPPAIIFTTAYDSHALAAFETQAIAYLLKPVRQEQLEVAIEKAGKLNLAQITAIGEQQQDPLHHHLSVQRGNATELIPIDEIDFFRAEQKYVAVYRGDQQYLLERPLKELEEEFSQHFVRIHRNSLVAIKAISKLRRDEQGHYHVILKDRSEPLEVSRRMVSALKALLK